jgi:DNA (cytosine-5)-methyltransferase 1
MLTVGSLFSGIGGFDLGLEMAGGFQIAWQIEKDSFCQKVLARHWPNVARYGDIRECGQGRAYPLSRVDVLCGGFPCQPHSLVGAVQGGRKASQDDRDLWPDFYRLICEIRPRWVLAENVFGLLSSEYGRFFSGILSNLATAGYDAEWTVLRASDIGAPHQRERVFIVGYPNGQRLEIGHGGQGSTGPCTPPFKSSTGQFKPVMGRVLDGLSQELDKYQWPSGRGGSQHGWEPSRTVNQWGLEGRQQRIQALGNAIVPQLVTCIGKYIQAANAA